MEHPSVNLPAARSWREIPQPVNPRAMSSGGRWRRTLASLRIAGLVTFVGGLAAGGWLIASALREESPHMPAVAKSVPVRAPELRSTDGVLDNAWLARTLALPPHVSLMELDLEKLRGRLLADAQVVTAAVTRQFPDRLIVHVTERAPVARVRVERAGIAHDMLVARDGVIFAGSGFDPGRIDVLPWLGGVELTIEQGRFKPIPRMEVVAQLLADAQLAADHIYQTWEVVSLARLESDAEIEVTTKDSSQIVFNANGGFFVQLARLDYLLEQLARLPPTPVRIDLSLGRDVPVRPLVAVAETVPVRGHPAKPRPLFHPLPFSPSSTQREL